MMDTLAITNRAATVRQTARAAELVGTALHVLCEDFRDGGAFAPVVERAAAATVELARVPTVLADDIPPLVDRARDLLEEALAIASTTPSPGSRESQSIEAIRRSSAILEPLSQRPLPRPTPRPRPEPPREVVERRIATRHAVQITVDFETEHGFYSGFTEDLSGGGLFVATHAVQSAGTRLSLELTMPDESVVRVAGIVRWTREPGDRDRGGPELPGMGVQFGSLSERDRASIEHFVARRSTIPHGDAQESPIPT
jgi:uncharacterized protein (TIGR02266 family)